jgi:hypothetical protein
MKFKTILAAISVGFILISCSDDDENNQNNLGPTGSLVLPDLTFQFDVTGAITYSKSWVSPENSAEIGGHNNDVISGYESDIQRFSLGGASGEFAFSMVASMPTVSSGTYTLTEASFIDSSFVGFGNAQSGTLTIDNASVHFTSFGVTYYDIDGSFSTTILDDAVPANTIVFEGSFNGLNVISN